MFSKNHNMKKLYTFALFLFIFSNINAQWIIVPDENFSEYLQSIGMTYVDTIPDNDHFLDLEKIQALTNLNVSGKSISNLSGIHHFTSLQTLNCSNNNFTSLSFTFSSTPNLTSLNVSNNSNLSNLIITGTNNLSNLDFSDNPQLAYAGINYTNLENLNASDFPKLTDLNVSDNVRLANLIVNNNPELTELDFSVNPALTDLVIQNNEKFNDNLIVHGYHNLTSLTFNINPSVEIISIINNENLVNVDISDNAIFYSLIIRDNPQLTGLNWSENPSLRDVYLVLDSGLVNIDFSSLTNDSLIFKIESTNNATLKDLEISNTHIRKLFVRNSNFTSTVINNNSNLFDLFITNNLSLTSVNVTNNNDLSSFELTGNESLSSSSIISNPSLWTMDINNNAFLTSLDISSNTSLKRLNIKNNQGLINVDLTSSSSIEILDIINNSSLEFIDLSNNPNLTSFDFPDNPKLNELDITGATSLGILNVYGTSLTNFDFSTNSSLTFLRFKGNFSSLLEISLSNKLEGIYINDNPNLTSATINNGTVLDETYCNNNPILTNLTFNNTPKLGLIDCSNNGLTNLNLNTNTSITHLNCSSNNLQNLDLRQYRTLLDLNCDDNQIADLNISGLKMLWNLECVNNKLPSLDLRSNTNLYYLWAYNNELKELDVTGLSYLETLQCSDNQLKDMDVSTLSNLEALNFENNQLENLIIGNHENMRFFWCTNNSLKSLNLSGLGEGFVEFGCSDNQLESLNIKNGYNTNLEDFYATGNPSLTCIQVDNIDYSNTNWSNIDAQTSFSENCEVSMSVKNVPSNGQIHDLIMENLSIAADGSSSTQFLLEGENLEKYSIKIKEDTDSKPDLYGSFQLDDIENNERKITYTHPELMQPFPIVQSNPLTLQVIDNETNTPIKEYPIKIVRPSVLMVHGIWSNGKDAFGNMESYLLQQGMYDLPQVLKMKYTNYQSNYLSLPQFMLAKSQLKNLARKENISFEKIDVLAHSNGGLLTRLYIQGASYTQDINKFITFNTPHSGSQLGDLLRDPAYNFTIEFISSLFFPIQVSSKIDKMINSGVIDNVSVNGNFIKNLNLLDNYQSKYVGIGVHAITSTDDIIDFSQILSNRWDNLIWKLIIADFKSKSPEDPIDALVNKIFKSENHDIIVPLESQRGGCEALSYYANQQHVGSTANQSFQLKTIELLNGSANNTSLFSKNGFKPTNLTSDFDPPNSNKLITQKKLVETISITNPTAGLEYKAGQIVSVDVTGSSGIQNIVSSMGSAIIPLQNHVVENASSTNFSLTIPDNALGRLEIVSAGFSANGFEDYDSTYIVVTTDAVLETIEIDQSRIFVSEGGESVITILGHYDDGIIRDITHIEELIYRFEDESAEIVESGLVSGIYEGEDWLIVTYSGKVATVPITISSATTLDIDDKEIIENTFSVFPNPTSNKLIIKFPVNQTKADISIYNLQGQHIFSKKVTNTNNELIIDEIQSGMYILKIETEKGIISKRIIKN